MQAFLEYLFNHNGDVTVVYPYMINVEDYALDLESKFYNKFSKRLNAKYTDYRIYKKKREIDFNTNYVVDPLCYELEIKQKNNLFDLILELAVKGRDNE